MKIDDIYKRAIDDIRRIMIKVERLESLYQKLDFVPVVRCKDCKHWDTTWQSNWGENCHYCPFTDGVHYGDWYCADAERKEE